MSSTPTIIDLSLQRITTLLSRLNSPQLKFPIIHVAGTNGKGTTTAYLDVILSKVVGLRTGRFNSPHLVEQQDSCRLNGEPISTGIWETSGKWVEMADEKRLSQEEVLDLRTKTSDSSKMSSKDGTQEVEGRLNSTYFELLTARTLLSFSLLPLEEKPEILIIEVGLGGSLDATNVFSDGQVLASVICPIDMDHENLLGNTLTEISKQKAGIIKKNGLIIVADQRRRSTGEEEFDFEEVDCSILGDLEKERLQLGRDGSEIMEAIRSEAALKNARMVKSFIDWEALNESAAALSLEDNEGTTEWQCTISSLQRFSPTLFLPSPPTSNQGRNRSINTGLTSLFPPAKSSSSSTSSNPQVPVYKCSIGDAPLPGPTLQLPPTRASLTGSHTALQTLFSIARDEPPSAMGLTGSDTLEELKLKIAYALRNGPGEKRLEEVLRGGVKWEGRAEWKRLEVKRQKLEDLEAKVEIQDEMKSEEQVLSDENQVEMQLDEVTSNLESKKSVLFLLDGAHNPSSAKALRSYINSCIETRVKISTTLTINWIMAFSEGKDVGEMLNSLLNFKGNDSLESKVQSMDLDSTSNLKLQHKICFVPFKTPIEGMPWVKSLSTGKAVEALESLKLEREGVVEVKEADNLEEGLTWISETRGVGDAKEINVICGSLYLIGEAHSL